MGLTRVGAIIAALIAAIVAVYAIFQALDARSGPPIVIEDAAGLQPVVVDVRGAVNAPGVYELAPGARMQDAITAAGGLSPSADLSTINLARRLRDGEAIVILETPPEGTTTIAPAGGAAAEPGAETTVRLNLNTATAAELTALPGIGETIAARIVQYRDEHGAFRSVDDLIHVQGVSARLIEQIRDLVAVGP